jgi:hypothetical protein
MKAFETSSKQATLLRVYVGDRTTWRDPSHPFRTELPLSRFIRGVPSLVKWAKDGPQESLGDQEAQDENVVTKFVG